MQSAISTCNHGDVIRAQGYPRMMRLVLLLTFSERNTYDLKATSGYKTVQCSPGVNQTLYLSPRGVSAGKGLNSIGTCYILSLMRSDFCYFKLTFQVCYDCTDGCATLPTSGLVSPHPGMTQWRTSGQTIVTTGGGGGREVALIRLYPILLLHCCIYSL